MGLSQMISLIHYIHCLALFLIHLLLLVDKVTGCQERLQHDIITDFIHLGLTALSAQTFTLQNNTNCVWWDIYSSLQLNSKNYRQPYFDIKATANSVIPAKDAC